MTAAGRGCTRSAAASPTTPTLRWSGRRRRANTVLGSVQVDLAISHLSPSSWAAQLKIQNCCCLDCSPSVVSPPRTPLGPLNSLGTNGASGQGITPQEDKLLRKVSKRNHRGETPLHCSAIKVRRRCLLWSYLISSLCQGNVAMVRKLLRMGADPNTQDNAGMEV